jgi:hypothetical protein
MIIVGALNQGWYVSIADDTGPQAAFSESPNLEKGAFAYIISSLRTSLWLFYSGQHPCCYPIRRFHWDILLASHNRKWLFGRINSSGLGTLITLYFVFQG